MKLAVLSGKGGAGKTFIAVNLAACASDAVYIDCDAEEPNGALFFRPEGVRVSEVTVGVPEFDAAKCTGCRRCVDFCRFNALAYINNRPEAFASVCHSCGGCSLVCPAGAVSYRQRPVGTVETGRSGGTLVISGQMNPGEVSGVPVIRAALAAAPDGGGLTVIDCPPGSSCSVMESIRDAGFCVLVAEPTAFGLHDLETAYELVSLFAKPCGAVINKAVGDCDGAERFCAGRGIPVLGRIKYSGELARLGAEGRIAALCSEEAARIFRGLLSRTEEAARG